jgi:peptidoglycan hydrolase CwlO-like protein
MKSTLTIHFEKQLQEGIDHIADNIKPYADFIHDKSQMINRTCAELTKSNAEVSELKKSIELQFRE